MAAFVHQGSHRRPKKPGSLPQVGLAGQVVAAFECYVFFTSEFFVVLRPDASEAKSSFPGQAKLRSDIDRHGSVYFSNSILFLPGKMRGVKYNYLLQALCFGGGRQLVSRAS